MAVSPGERTLGIEFVIVVLMITGDAIAGGAKGSLGGAKLPNPARYFAAMIVFLMLAGVAAFGAGAAKVASRLGGLATLAILLAPPNIGQPIGPGNRPLIVRFLNLLNSYMISGAVSQAGQSPVNAINPKTLVPSTPGPGGTGNTSGGLGLGPTILGPGVLGGVPSSSIGSGQSTYVPGGPTQIYQQPVGPGGVA